MYKFIIKDAFWQIVWRVVSAFAGFLIIYFITPYLWTIRFWDYGTLIRYFAFWSALSDLWFYVLGLRQLWSYMNKIWISPENTNIPKEKKIELETYYSKIVFSRWILILFVYLIAIVIAYLIPSYRQNPYIFYWLPLSMLFSALFMWAGIVQLPLQIFWKMEQVSISLILARICQIIFLVFIIFIFFPKASLWEQIPINVFLRIISSMVLSSLVQFLYTYWFANKNLKLRFVKFWAFTIQTIKQNRQYWIWYFLSSSPILSVALMFSWLLPTISGNDVVWVWWLWLQIITILLIIPPSIWNSILHKLSEKSKLEIQYIFWNFFILMFFVWLFIFTNFLFFGQEIISYIWWKEYISDISIWSNFQLRFGWEIKSDIVIVFLSIVLLISFIKQVFNYLTISQNMQNKLLKINIVWILFWFILWFLLIPKYWILWWFFTQISFEIIFLIWLVIINKKNSTLPIINLFDIAKIILFFCFFIFLFYRFGNYDVFWKTNTNYFISYIIWTNIFIISCRFLFLKNKFKWII